MKRFALLLLPLGVMTILLADVGATDTPTKLPSSRPPALFSKVGRHHHPIATKVSQAQEFFDQGMTLLYGFNHAEAIRSFERAAELDSNSPMPHWGIALALGPNYNRDIDPIDAARRKKAHEAAQKAVALAARAPEQERAYAKALALRYSPDPKSETRPLEIAYRKAMTELAAKFPDDLDAQTLLADAIMVLNPWKLWNKDGKPAEGTEEVLALLEEVLRRDPDHIGANHLYIHAIEASPWPERGLPSADRLLKRVPWQGHLVHMPAHIYIHTGDHELASLANERGIQADEEYIKAVPEPGLYRMMYYSHNIHFLAYARAAQGNFTEAMKAAEKLVREVEPSVQHAPPMEGFLLMPTQVLLRFHRWDDILKLPRPGAKRMLSRAWWLFARATALAQQGKLEEAGKEQRAFEVVRQEIPKDTPLGSNSAAAILEIASELLHARLTREPKQKLEHLRKAVQLQDALQYGEPPDWYYPIRETLGAALLQAGRPEEAERIFRQDLKQNRRNPRSLFGLAEALRAQKREWQADNVEVEFRRVWKGPALKLSDY